MAFTYVCCLFACFCVYTVCMHCIFYSYNYAFDSKVMSCVGPFCHPWMAEECDYRLCGINGRFLWFTVWAQFLNPIIFPSWHPTVLLGNLSKYFTINHFWEPFNCSVVLSEWLRHYPGALHHLTSCLLTLVLWCFFAVWVQGQVDLHVTGRLPGQWVI